jgi:hypothetical protein
MKAPVTRHLGRACRGAASALALAALVTACGLSTAQVQARTASGNACLRLEIARQPACFTNLPPITEDEPASCAYYYDSQGWVAASFLPKGSGLWAPGGEVTAATLSDALKEQFGSPDVRAASRGCLVAMTRALATHEDAEKLEAQAKLERAQREAEEKAKAAAAAEAAAKLAARQADLVKQFAPAVEECKSKWLSLSSKCVDIPGLSDDERLQCQRACADDAEHGYKEALAAVQTACASATTPPKCKLTKPPGAFVDDARLKADLNQCTQACRDARKASAPAHR